MEYIHGRLMKLKRGYQKMLGRIYQIIHEHHKNSINILRENKSNEYKNYLMKDNMECFKLCLYSVVIIITISLLIIP